MSIYDKITHRRGTGAIKWDATELEGVIPLWVADMDFEAAPVIIDALRRRVDHGVFGYCEPDKDYFKAITNWFSTRHGYDINPEMVILTPGVVPALSAIIKGLTKPGDGVVFFTPAYNCFFSSVRNNGCTVIENKLVHTALGNGLFTYTIDFGNLESCLAREDAKVMILCNPHNPGGRLWSKDELTHIAQLCKKHKVQVISDEIHCELTAPGTNYIPFATIEPNAIVCNSPSKAFNTAGLHIANTVCPNKEIYDKVNRAVNINEVCDVNPFGIEALKAAYTDEGEEWLTGVRQYLWDNYDFLVEKLNAALPQCPVTRLEATYLPWIDVRALGVSSDTIEHRLMEEAHVWVNSGTMYGIEGYIRINVATQRERLEEGLNRLINWAKCI